MVKKFFTTLNKIEYAITMFCIVSFTSILLLGALIRVIGHPLNWENDIALFLLAWATFLGGDVAFRSGRLVNTGIIIEKFPVKLQKTIAILVYVIIIAMMLTMIVQGITLCKNVGKRTLEGIPQMSYLWVVLAVPVSFSLMVLTAVERLVGILKCNDPLLISRM